MRSEVHGHDCSLFLGPTHTDRGRVDQPAAGEETALDADSTHSARQAGGSNVLRRLMRDKAVAVLVDDDGVVAVSVVVKQHLYRRKREPKFPDPFCMPRLHHPTAATQSPHRRRKGIDGLHIASVGRIHKSPYRDPP